MVATTSIPITAPALELLFLIASMVLFNLDDAGLPYVVWGASNRLSGGG